MKRKLFFYFSIIMVCSILLSVFVGYRTIKNFMVSDVEKLLKVETGLARQLIEEELKDREEFPASVFFAEVAGRLDCRLTLILIDGRVYYDSEMDAGLMANHMDRPEVREAILGKTNMSSHYSETLKQEFLYSTTPIYKNGKLSCILRLSSPLNKAMALVHQLSRSLVVSIAAGLVVAFFFAYVVTGYIVKPITSVAEIALKEANMNGIQDTAIFKGNELALISTAFRNMSNKLNESKDTLSDKNIKMEAILSSIVNGVIAIDNEEKVLFVNSSAHKLLKIKEEKAEGKYFYRIVRNRIFNSFVEKAVGLKEYCEAEIQSDSGNGRIFRVYSNPIKHKESKAIQGIIVVIQDITEIRKLERLRRDFTANVSHELKTPLTSIKGFAETLKGGAIEDPEAAERFLGIIQSESERLHRLIEDILNLTEVELGKSLDYSEEFDFEQALGEVISILSVAAENRKVTIVTEIEPGLPMIFGERDQFKQMLINLLDNGIKYNKEGGQIFVKAGKDLNGNIHISVKDTGIGIDEEHLPRIFERFYRVDKARSRKYGGTGLGLAIVKHIVLNFEGKIEIRSEKGQGTEFLIELPTDLSNI